MKKNIYYFVFLLIAASCMQEKQQLAANKEYIITYKCIMDSNTYTLTLLQTDELIYGKCYNSATSTVNKVIGNIETDSSCRLEIFDNSNHVIGIVSHNLKDTNNNATWFTPSELTETNIALHKVVNTDSFVLEKNMADKSGFYSYSYGEISYKGHVELKKIIGNTYAFTLFVVGNGTAPPIAEIPEDTITIVGNSFAYKIKNATNCAVKVNIYKDFLQVSTLTDEDCFTQFGKNAFPDGNYVKE
jgi:hypothetical protein